MAEIDNERLMALMELIRRGTGSVPTADQLTQMLMVFELGTIGEPERRPTGRDLEMVVLLVGGMHAATQGPVHVMTRDKTVARRLEDACRKVFNPNFVPVDKVGKPSFTSERRISVGTYEDFASARARFDKASRASAGILPLALAVGPVPATEREAIRSCCTRLVEL